MTAREYWEECIACAADGGGFTLTEEQIKCLAEACEGAHDNYGMAFYSPPPSDRIAVITREKDHAIAAIKTENEINKRRAERAVIKALGLYEDSNISIEEDGEVYVHDGRTRRVL